MAAAESRSGSGFSTQRAQIYPAAAGPLCVSPQQKQPEDLLSQPDLPGLAPGQQGLYGGQSCDVFDNLISVSMDICEIPTSIWP